MSVSVIIPCFNGKQTIGSLVTSVLKQEGYKDEDEVIVVDDCSTDDSANLAIASGARLLSMTANSGPAAARNAGVSEAKNEIIMFLDADTHLEPGSLARVKIFFKENQNSNCVNGRCSIEPLVSDPARDYKAMVEFDWHEDMIRRGILPTCFNARIGAIRKASFIEAGGFDANIRGADVEDYEFGYRLLEHNIIDFDSNIRVRHLFPGFWGTLKDYWSRAGKWAELFFNRRKFDSGGTSAGNALGHVLGVMLLPALALAFVWPPSVLILLLVAVMLYSTYSHLLALAAERKGILGVISILAFHVLYSFVILLSAMLGFFRAATSVRRGG